MTSIRSCIILIVALTSLAFAQNRAIYTHPDFASLAANHQVVAFLPFTATLKLRPKQMEQFTAEQLAETEKAEGLAVQAAMEAFFLRRLTKKQYSIRFQEVNKTNALLSQNGIEYENISEYTSEQLSKILGVDAVITGNLVLSKPMSDGASVAMAVLVGFWGNTNAGRISISAMNGADGTLLWRYEKSLSRSLGSDTNTVINALMRKAARKFPYEDI